jgi:hypothetical protein
VDKATPHYTLDDILAQMVTVDEMNLTLSARNGIWDAGLTQAEALSVVQNLPEATFIKA